MQSHKLAMMVRLTLLPVSSPDSTCVRFTINDPKTVSSALWELAIDGTGLYPVLQGWNTIANECCGKWTSDGQYFVFQTLRQNISSIWIRPEKSSFFRKLS